MAETERLQMAGPKLKEAFDWGPTPLLLHGSYNSAKTVTLCLKTLMISETFPGYRWFVGRRVWDELRKTTMSSFFKFCSRKFWEPKGRRSDVEKILVLNNGSSYLWGHLDDPDTLTLVRGLEINGFLLDQMEELFEEIFTSLIPRLGRWDKVTVPLPLVKAHCAQQGLWAWTMATCQHCQSRTLPFNGIAYVCLNCGKHQMEGKLLPPSYALATANPDHELHWMYSRFDADDPLHHEKRILVEKEPRVLADGRIAPVGTRVSFHDLGYKMISVSAYDNKYATRQSLEEMEAMDETWKHRFLHGKKGIPEGQIHVVRPESILEPSAAVLAHIHSRCNLHRSMDHGDSAPTCCIWWGVDGDGNIFAYREYYAPNRLISEHRANITALSKLDNDRYMTNFADPAIFGPSMQKNNQRWSVAEEYADTVSQPRETAIFWQRGDNDELGTRNRISEYLRPSGVWEFIGGRQVEVPRIHPITKAKGLWPRLFFVKATPEYLQGCDHLIRQMRSARRMKIGTENGRPIFSDERDPRVADHALDPARYFIASCPSLPHTLPKKYSERSFFGMRAMAIKAKRKGDLARFALEAKRLHS